MEKWVKLSLATILALLAAFIPLASTYPDGLEKVAESLGIKEPQQVWSSPFPGYVVEAIPHEYLSVLVAGVIGTMTVFILTWLLGKALRRGKR